ncbi:hypothetical protein Q73_03735 [Bacillus coahuilensis m2-6]|nr:hypothetical protein Q73_03735 [Bacillus coahuilensis m2-6]
MGASRKALFAFWEVTTTLEGLAAGAGHREKRSRLGRGVQGGGLIPRNKGNTESVSDPMLTYKKLAQARQE